MSAIDDADTQIPQDGRLRVKALGKSVDVRVSIAPSIEGPSVVMRLLDTSKLLGNLDNLGLAEPKVKMLRSCDSDSGEGAAGLRAAGSETGGGAKPGCTCGRRLGCAVGALNGTRAQATMRGRPPGLREWEQVRLLRSGPLQKGQAHFSFLLLDQNPEFFARLFRDR